MGNFSDRLVTFDKIKFERVRHHTKNVPDSDALFGRICKNSRM